MGERIIHSWSSGKDSAVALANARAEGYEIEALVTVVRDDDRVSVHGVRRELLREQAKCLRLPLMEIKVDTLHPYEQAVAASLREFRELGISKISYGDLFLESIREWRETFHGPLGFSCLYPVWNTPTDQFAREFIASGRKAVLTCVDTKRLDASFAGRDYDQTLIDDLPEGVDPCGENGEFHTFVYDGPEFFEPVRFSRSDVEIREFDDPGHKFTFGFCDLKALSESER